MKLKEERRFPACSAFFSLLFLQINPLTEASQSYFLVARKMLKLISNGHYLHLYCLNFFCSLSVLFLGAERVMSVEQEATST
jgi:hypothetical protein